MKQPFKIKHPKKYNEETVNIIIEILSEGRGRVAAVKEAGITYHTFINWMEDVQFLQRIKKAEFIGYDRIKQSQIDKVINDKNWTSAAWWLERKYPDEFGKREPQTKDTIIEKKTIIYQIENNDNIEITV
jgi:hypothetical protein